MKFTKDQKREIRNHWFDSYLALKFCDDGRVLAKRNPWSAWGLLYTKQQAESHLEAKGLLQ